MEKVFSKILALGLLAGLAGLAVYYFGFGQTFEGEVEISAGNDDPAYIGLVTFQSRFKNRRFLTHSMFLDVSRYTPVTYGGEPIEAEEAVERFDETEIQARVGYREEKPGWGYVVSLDLEPPGTSPKEMLLLASLVLIFGCTIGMAMIARAE